MKVLLVLHQNPDGYPAGVEQYILDLISGLSFKGVDVYLFFPEKNSLKLRSYKSYSYEETIYEGGFTDFTLIKEHKTECIFNKVLMETDPHIVHFHSLRSLPLSLIEIAKNKNKKVIITLHEYFLWCIHFILLNPNFCDFEKNEKVCYECLISQGFKISNDFIANRRQYISSLFSIVDAVVSPSYYVRDKFFELYSGLDPDKCKVIELGIRKEYFQPIEQFQQKNSGGHLRVGFLGNFLYHKGSKIFMQLVEEFKDSNELEFYIFGNIYDPILTKYPNLKKYGGYARTLIDRILKDEKIDVNLLLSIQPETFSYTLTESMASGVPVIAHDIGALRERVKKYNAGFLVPYENSIHYIISILKDMNRHREILSFFRQKCSESARDILSVDDMIEAHYEFYLMLSNRYIEVQSE